MPTLPIRPPADPLDDIDRPGSGADSLMERQDRADLPGERRDAPEAKSQARDPVDDGDIEAALDEAPDDIERAEHGVDSDDPIDEVERSGPDGGR